MFEKLLIHPRTLTQLERFTAAHSHGLILSGPEGSGKKTLAHAVAAELLGLDADKLQNYPYFTVIDPKEPTITIDEIRSLQKLLTLRTPHTDHAIRRVILVIDAERMRSEAQNSFLKSLEEPPADTCIIFTSGSRTGLLDTIRSRMQNIDVLPVGLAAAREFYTAAGLPLTALEKNFAISQGQVGLLHSLLSDTETHALKASVEKAKQLLAATPGERLLQVDGLAKDKQETSLLLDALGRISHAALMHAGKAGNRGSIHRWEKAQRLVLETKDALRLNANTKLALDQLLLNI